ncbi:hypothetical protein COLO4_09139 [Corchorus olitorius]|uniref:Uncharacterized protein n=1 Tax=Corchorus olitorius TaxID=93759 RepID=A0A1R3KD37_9ROSI|nr:hypothetical protein COLO4_09139 [Corchorus olitorius]
MASLQDITVSAAINLLSAFAFLVAFAMLRLQPINDRVYFPKWYRKGIRSSPRRSGAFVTKFVNLDWRTYIKFLNWMPAALRMPEPELIDHAGLDSVVYIRIYLLGLKLFVPLAVLAFGVLVPVNWTGGTLEHIKNLTFSDIDKLSISNVSEGSKRTVAAMRLRFLASETRRPDQFTVSSPPLFSAEDIVVMYVIVRNVPPDPDETVSEHVEHFFSVNHPDYYLTHQVVYNANTLAKLVDKKKSLQNWYTYYSNKYEKTLQRPSTKSGFCGLIGATVDALDYYSSEIEKLSEIEAAEREKVMNDPKAIVPAAFVSFKSRWGAAVCAQTQLCRNPTIWLTEWAPEPRDVYWDNLAIPYFELTVRRETIKSVIQGFLPGIALKIFLILLPTILMAMSKIEGFTSLSSLDRRSAGKYHLFILVNVFLGSIITGTALQQLKSFLDQSPTEIPKTIGVSIPMKATFFITYVMVDGWAGIAAEILRLVPLIMFHLKNAFLVKTEQDRDQAMDPGCWDFATSEPRIQFYILLGLVYSAVTPVLLPFIIIFFAFSYVVSRHQVINVYDQNYESGASFWPDVHRRLIISILISHVLLIGLLSTKQIKQSTIALLPLPVLTFWFHRYCKGRFESAFVRFPLQEAMIKDTLERATEPNLNLKAYIQDAYIHPVFKGTDLERPQSIFEDENNPLVPTKRNSKQNSEAGSITG